MKELLLECVNVSINFSGKNVFENVTLRICKGDCHVITGKSGSGKSVLLKAIAGNIGLHSGILRYYFNQDQVPVHQLISLAGSKHYFKNLSNTGDLYYQQRYNSADAEDSLTVKQYLLNVNGNNNSSVYWTIEKTITALHLIHLYDKQLIKLSNGETKRLMIAAALLKNPVLLLLDNPLAGLDVATRVEFNALLQEIINSGITLIMATAASHLPDITTHVSLLKDGALSTCNKTEFEAHHRQTDNKPVIDLNALKDLLNANNLATYEHIVEMKNVSIKYGDKLVLDQINWAVKPGERWALLGHNGAGKSTLLSLINGDNPQAYANHIVLFDKRRGTGESIWDIKSKIGFVSPELYQYFPADNSCLQVIESGFYDTLGLFRASSAAKASLALKWMDALEISQYARMLLKNIPAAAQRLCLLARALIKNPPLLIFDEPCQGLDEQQQQHFKVLVDAICSISKVTLIYVTHYPHEIPNSVDKVLRLENGKVVSGEWFDPAGLKLKMS